MKRNIAVGGLIALAALITTTPAFALHDIRETTKEVHSETSKTLESTTDKAVNRVANTVESTKSATERIEEKKLQLEDRKAALQARLETKLAERKSKLEGRRLAQCQNRQDRINELLGKSVEKGQRHIENIKRFEERVTAFAVKKAIDSAAYQDALSDVELKHGLAVSAVEVMETQTFDCAAVDGSKPADIVRTTREEKHAAVKAYRDSVIVYLQTVKAAFAASQSQTDKEEQ